MSHRPHILPTPDGFHAACTCSFTSATVKEILVAHFYVVTHRKWEAGVQRIIDQMNAKGFLVALEDL